MSMRELLLVRFGEVHLKGQNRPYFLRTLVEHVRHAVEGVGGKVWLNDSRIFVSDVTDMDECVRRVTRVFGIHSVSPAIEMEKDDIEAICAQASAMMAEVSGSFKVAARRSDKRYPLNSPQINAKVGGYVLAHNPQLHVEVNKPKHLLDVEIRDKAYLYVKRIAAVGGMPLGTNGKACLLLSGGIDSPVAGYMIAKRGVELCAVHYYSPPYTSERAKEKVIDLARILSEYCVKIRLAIVPFTNIQMEIHKNCPPQYTTLIMRRYMMRLAERVARDQGAKALITGESVGQVASQTMDALGCTDVVVNMPVFRPVVGFDKSEIIERAEKIGTYETSALPFEDCCTIFTPRHPATHPRLDIVEKAEEAIINSQVLLDEAFAGIEYIDIEAK